MAERLEDVLAALNVTGWRVESDHGCDGTEEVCMETCPIPVQVEVDPREIAAAVRAHLAERAQDEGVREAVAFGLYRQWCTQRSSDYPAEPFAVHRDYFKADASAATAAFLAALEATP